MPDPTQVLMDEHRVIEGVLDCLARMIDQVQATGTTDWTAARQAVHFFREFADRCHHHKEEDLLFPALERCGFSAEEGPTAVMRNEHQLGRRWVQAMQQALDQIDSGQAEAATLFRDAAVGYLYLLREHIQKEDQCLFPMARQSLSAEEQAQLVEKFQTCPQAQAHDELLQLARGLQEQFAPQQPAPGGS